MAGQSISSTSLPLSSPERAFSGLSNPGATCYMNSLLQTLYMTPEFRFKLYQFVYDPVLHGSSEDCIPYQLQLLFARLQLSHLKCIDTTGLIHSFHWDTAEIFQQHDAQEFCRVLLDAVEESVQEAPKLRHVIGELYGGTLLDYVKCQQCGQTSSREADFLDLSLTVRSEIDHLHPRSVEEALKAFFKPERLTGDNQVFCEQCQNKGDALKGFRLKTLPPILMLQLKRFDLDSQHQRRKLNDFISFPEVLNMNPFFLDDQSANNRNPGPDSEEKPTFFQGTSYCVDANERCFDYRIDATQENLSPDKDLETLEMDAVAIFECRRSQAKQRKQRCSLQSSQYLTEGKDVFELFSVMVHSGSALGGHYFAYIKSIETQHWFVFDDLEVYEIDESEVWKAFGSDSGVYGTNAYLLMYRRVDNEETLPDLSVPETLRKVLEEEGRVSEEQEDLFSFLVYYDDQHELIQIPTICTFGDLKAKAISDFNLGMVSDSMRLMVFLPQDSIVMESMEPYEDCRLEAFYHQDFVRTLKLESKPTHLTPDFDPDSIRLSIEFLPQATDSQIDLVPKRRLLKMLKTSQVADLHDSLPSLLGIAPNVPLGVWKWSSIPTLSRSKDLKESTSRFKSLPEMGLFDGTKIYVEDLSPPLKRPRWDEVFLAETNRLFLYFTDPRESEGCRKLFSKGLFVDRRQSLRQVKSLLADRLDLSPDQFYMKKHRSTGPEIINLDVNVKEAGLVSGNRLYVQLGDPIEPSNCRLYLDLAVGIVPEEDEPWYIYLPFCSFVLPSETQIRQLRLKVSEHVVRELASKVDPNEISIRERYGDRPGKALDDDQRLSACPHSEKRRLSVHYLHENYRGNKKNSLPISFRVWDPETFRLSEPMDVAVDQGMSLHELGKLLETLGNVRNLQVCRVSFPRIFSRLDLNQERWHVLEKKRDLVSGFPLFLSVYGGFLVLKDGEKLIRPASDAEILKYEKKRPHSELPKLAETVKERGIKIRVKKI